MEQPSTFDYPAAIAERVFREIFSAEYAAPFDTARLHMPLSVAWACYAYGLNPLRQWGLEFRQCSSIVDESNGIRRFVLVRRNRKWLP